jgi:hypothetical protein
MSSNAPSPDEKGRILPFQRRGGVRPVPPHPALQDDTPVEGLGKYANTGEPDNYRQRMINNGLGLAACIVLVIIGVWIANTMAEMRRNQDCVLSGRRDCTRIVVPSANPTK